VGEWIKTKIVKKRINIESETVGTPVGPAKEKTKKLDFTDEIKNFLNGDINLDSIKRILLISIRQKSTYSYENSSIKIVDSGDRDFFIVIREKKKPYAHKWFVSWFSMTALGCFKAEEVDTSPLKSDLAHAIRQWCHQNRDKLQVVFDGE
jgi:hypothetical protein